MNRDDHLDITFEEPQERPAGVDFADASAPADEQAATEAGAPEAPLGSVTQARRPEVMPIREDEPAETPAPVFDWLTEVAIPLGIFGLLGCFLYYLIDLRAALGGEFSNALRWVCFWFLLAAILITRIRTKYGNAAVALPYVLGLGLVTAIVVTDFTFRAGALAGGLSPSGEIVSLLFNLSLVGLTWWGAHRVTRDCTIEDNLQHSLGQGFLSDLSEERRGPRPGKAAARHPGRVILWVTVAAVIAFGLGTRAMGDESRYAANAFRLMAGYVFFALFLLAMTNLSAIRMDVRRRKVWMMRGLTATWIGASMALVLLVVGLSSVVPRPRAATDRPFEPGERAAWLRDPRQTGLEHGPTAGLGDPPGRATAPGREADATGDGRPAEQGEAGQDAAGMDRGHGTADGQGEGGPSAESPEGGQGTGEAAGAAAAQEAAGGGGSQSDQDTDAGRGGEGSAGAGGRTDSGERGLASKFNWWLLLLLLLLIAALIYLAIRYRKYLLPFLHAVAQPLRAAWLAFLAFLERLRRLLGRRRRAEDPFADLPEDPFADIWEQRELGAGLTPAQIVRHVYRAFMAFCSLRGHPRRDQQTELEFLRTVPPRIGLPEDDQRNLTNIYVFATYSPAEVSHSMVDAARDIWSRLRPSIDNALSAQGAQGR